MDFRRADAGSIRILYLVLFSHEEVRNHIAIFHRKHLGLPNQLFAVYLQFVWSILKVGYSQIALRDHRSIELAKGILNK